ncbi:MAG: hypothetical protein H0U28_12290 [Nocardioidaceae bacterium]|nr:hypothetical protein [Nocardioidaceae bacterium]
MPLVLGGIATAAALALRVVGRLRRVVGALGAAVGAGLTLTAVLQFWLGSLDGSYLANTGIVSLGIAAIVTSVLGLHNVLGHAGLGLGALTMLLLGNPLSGITSAPELLPAGWGTLGQWLPPGAMGTGLRSTAFFDGAALGLPLTVLGLWLLAGLTMLLLPVRAARTSTAPAPAAASTNRLEANPPKM